MPLATQTNSLIKHVVSRNVCPYLGYLARFQVADLILAFIFNGALCHLTKRLKKLIGDLTDSKGFFCSVGSAHDPL